MEKIITSIFIGIGAFFAFIGLIAIVGLLISWPVMLLWNGCVVGIISGISPIPDIWHAWGILILCGLLFKSSNNFSKS